MKTQAPTTLSTTPRSVKVAMFGDLSIDDGAVHMTDGGIDGIQGHTLVIRATGQTTWQRRLDTLDPSGKAGGGEITLTDEETHQVQTWADGLWTLAPGGNARFYPAPHDAPRWVWAIVLRRGDEVRVLEGGDMDPTTSVPPAPAKSALAWLIKRVDAAATAH